jgi:hypothetical protein
VTAYPPVGLLCLSSLSHLRSVHFCSHAPCSATLVCDSPLREPTAPSSRSKWCSIRTPSLESPFAFETTDSIRRDPHQQSTSLARLVETSARTGKHLFTLAKGVHLTSKLWTQCSSLLVTVTAHADSMDSVLVSFGLCCVFCVCYFCGPDLVIG